MVLSENLLGVAQNFATPDMIQKFSEALGEPAEKIRTGLKAVIPALLMGIVTKGSTPEGAQSLTQMAKRTPTPTTDVNPAEIDAGTQTADQIFDGNLNSTASKLGASTGLSSLSVTKMMGLATPILMGVLGSKIQKDGLNSSGLMSFLSQQKATLGVLMPDALSARFSNATEGVDISLLKTSPSRSWMGVGLIALVAILAGLWVFSRNQNTPIIRDSSPVAVTDTGMVPASEALPQSLDTLENFLAAPVASELPKRFRFENLHFEAGTTTLITGSEVELGQIASALMAHPQARARLEAFTDSDGQPEMNRVLSQRRAEAVRDQLIARGIAANQVEAVGLGDQNPVASNESEEGKAMNRRVEFIITEAPR